MKHYLIGYFDGSLANLSTSFVREKDVSPQELEALQREIRKSSKPGQGTG